MDILDRIPGTGVSCKAGNTLPDCDVCQLSKSKQRDHPKHRTTKPTTRKLELVYTDLQGPLQPSLQNYSYIAMFMDDLTKIKKPYFLQAKSGALDYLYNFVRDIAIPEGLHVGRLRSDNGGEYTGKAFRDYCKTVGIKQEFTAPYTPQQNAAIERAWGALMAVTRCLLQESGLPSVLWP
ncbi:unnamed protein product [Discosporangium mesarthrocarpum]